MREAFDLLFVVSVLALALLGALLLAQGTPFAMGMNLSFVPGGGRGLTRNSSSQVLLIAEQLTPEMYVMESNRINLEGESLLAPVAPGNNLVAALPEAVVLHAQPIWPSFPYSVKR